MRVVKKQIIIPQIVGIANAKTVHFKLPVSFFMLIKVVLQGKCIRLNSITFIAVSKVQPFDISILDILDKLSICVKVLPDI